MSNLVPDGWSKPRLKEVVTHFQNGYAFSAKGYVESGIPIISMGSIQLDGQFKKVNSKLKFWDSGKKEELSRYLVKPRDLIMAMTDVTPTMELIGRSCIVKGESEYFLNQRVGLISFDEDEISKEYFSYYTNFNEWRSYCIGSSGLGAQANLGTSQILDGFVTLPPLPEQQKIAKILTSVDEVIEKIQAQIDKLKDLKTGMMQELLTNGIGHTEFKDSPVGRIPAEWEVKTLVDCSDKMTNGFVGATRGIYQDDGIPYVLCQNVKPNKFIEVIYKYVNSDFHLKNIRAELKEGDVLTVQTGAGNGDTCVVPKSFVGANCHALIITRLKHNVVNPYFFAEYMNSDLGKNRVNIIATGGAHPHLNTTDLRRELVPVPPIEEQNLIVETLLSIQKKFEILEKKNDTNKNTKKALMQDLLTGKVRVKVS